jgi:hypothetical protein
MKYKLYKMSPFGFYWILLTPNGMIYIEKSHSDAVVRMDLHAGSMGKMEAA